MLCLIMLKYHISIHLAHVHVVVVHLKGVSIAAQNSMTQLLLPVQGQGNEGHP